MSTAQIVHLLNEQKWKSADKTIVKVLEAKVRRAVAEARQHTFQMVTEEWFDSYGNLTGDIPDEAVQDCSAQGAVDDAVAHWQKKLNFTVPRDRAIKWLKGYGAWDDSELKALDDTSLAQKVLWLACGDIKENGEFFGIVESVNALITEASGDSDGSEDEADYHAMTKTRGRDIHANSGNPTRTDEPKCGQCGDAYPCSGVLHGTHTFKEDKQEGSGAIKAYSKVTYTDPHTGEKVPCEVQQVNYEYNAAIGDDMTIVHLMPIDGSEMFQSGLDNVKLTESTWHQDQAGPRKLYSATEWNVVTDPPNQLTTIMGFSTHAAAGEYLINLENHHPELTGHSYILPPGGTQGYTEETNSDDTICPKCGWKKNDTNHTKKGQCRFEKKSINEASRYGDDAAGHAARVDDWVKNATPKCPVCNKTFYELQNGVIPKHGTIEPNATGAYRDSRACAGSGETPLTEAKHKGSVITEIFGNLGVHVIQFPSGKYGFVGSIPTVLGNPVKATSSDIMGGRAYTGPDGATMTLKFPAFDSAQAALDYAQSKGITAHTNEK